jgi:AGZA family xanthine/uracil permease-like MFS transporter
VVLGAIAAFIIDRDFLKASAFSFAGATLTFFGLMHGESIGFNQTPVVAAGYLLVAAVLFGCYQFAIVPSPHPLPAVEHGHDVAEFDEEQVAPA